MATSEEYAHWIVANSDKKGTPEFDTVAAAYKDSIGKDAGAPQPATEAQKSDGNPVMNAVLGFSARGNQAMNALNPFASQESNDRIAAEQEWVKQHDGAGIGSTLADMAITAPAGAGAGAAIRSLATGAIEGATHGGSLADKIKEAGYSTLGAGMGEGAANAIGFIAKPFKENLSPLVAKAKAMGMNLNAAQLTGNKSLQYADSALDYIPSSSTMQHELKTAQRNAWQRELLKQGGEVGQSASPEVMGAMKDRISSVYNEVAGRNQVTIDAPFHQELAKVSNDLLGRIPTNQKGIVKSYLNDFNTVPVGGQIDGKTYQDIRSMLAKQAEGFKNTDPATHQALKSIQSAADSAMERSLVNKPGDAEAWKKANKDWLVMRTIEKAADPLTGDVSPAKLLSNLARKDSNRVIYGKGNQELTDIARVGKEFISPKIGDSGTAQRAMMIKLLTGGGVGAIGTMAAYDPEMAAKTAAGSIAASILLPKAAGRAMWKENGYLSKGLTDLSKEVAPGLSRQRIISELMRNAGTQSSN